MSTAPILEFTDRKILPYGEKARRFAIRHPKDDKKINVLEGAIRSAKTWTMIPKIIQLLDYEVKGHKLITGVSKQTIYNNVLTDLFEVLGPSNYSYNRQSGELVMMGDLWQVMGAKDEGSEKYIRGMTVGVVVDDEMTLKPKSFLMMLLNRLSPAGARFYGTTNPDNPFHYVKTDIIDNQELRDGNNLFVEHFGLDDNPNVTGVSDLTPEGKKQNDAYKKYLKTMYKGVYYLRYILGQWVVAEGAIYRDSWSDDESTYDGPTPTYVDNYIGVDCGVVHPQVYLDCKDDGDTLWFDREYYWDSEVQMRQKTNGEYADDLVEFAKASPDAQIILPPEVASFDLECRNRGLWVTDADNDVPEGIKMVSSLMALRKIKFRRAKTCITECVCGKQCCTQTVKEIPSYAWDPKKALRGLEEPIKQKDDGCDAVRYVVKTKVPRWRIGLAA